MDGDHLKPLILIGNLALCVLVAIVWIEAGWRIAVCALFLAYIFGVGCIADSRSAS